MGSQMKKQFGALAFFLIAKCTMAYSPYYYESTYNKAPTTIAKGEGYKVPSMPENEYKTLTFLSKNEYDKKTLVSENNEKKVPSVA
ncbi:hypothetical protein EJD97_025178 [Solanum chilense]|uniref:Uncharacterized protein n=1 Tax=Solanum chilense TaxID=4083 RepID=A0A6N2ASC6_SOLCI|nr:hypothetical protein EJD97_025178 [Solanum chilense]